MDTKRIELPQPNRRRSPLVAVAVCIPVRTAAMAAAALAVVVAIGLAGCGAGDAQLDAAAEPTASAPTPTADSADPATGQPPGNTGGAGTGNSGSGNSGSGNSGAEDDGDGQADEPKGRPPRITYPDVHAYVTGGELVAEAYGHAFDDDGPDPQLRVERVEVQWGDGTTTTSRLEGHGAFRDYHDYESSYEGRTVTVRIVAYGHDGQTASETVTVDLPS